MPMPMPMPMLMHKHQHQQGRMMHSASTRALALELGEVQHWLGLSQLKAAHRRTAISALREYGTPTAVFESVPDLRERFGKPFAQSILALPHVALHHAAECALAWRNVDPDTRHIVALADPAYPSRLLQAADPPLLLFVHGQLELLARPSIAVVGSRKPSQQGQENAYAFSRALTQAGWTIVSGLAQGIDARAHQAALDETKAKAAEAKGANMAGAPARASTIAVIGTGIDVIYPWQHRSLSDAISGAGAIVSEWPLGTPARAAHFPQRNRLIAALSHGVLVVEATLRSGSLITARIANDIGRDVFAIPGSIHAPQSRGCHALIKEGAKLVDSVDDILSELTQTELPKSLSGMIASALTATAPRERPCPSEGDDSQGWSDKTRATDAGRYRRRASPSQPAPPARTPPDDDIARQVLDLLGHDPATADTLAERGRWDAATLIGTLTRLEIGGWVEQQAGRYVRTAG